MPHHDDESLKIIDTDNGLTREELKELKKLASLSKTAKILVSAIFAVITLVGADHLVDWLKHAR